MLHQILDYKLVRLKLFGVHASPVRSQVRNVELVKDKSIFQITEPVPAVAQHGFDAVRAAVQILQLVRSTVETAGDAVIDSELLRMRSPSRLGCIRALGRTRRVVRRLPGEGQMAVQSQRVIGQAGRVRCVELRLRGGGWLGP